MNDAMVQRVIRVPEELWAAAKIQAAERGETVSEVIRARLEKYAPARRMEGLHAGLGKVLLGVMEEAQKAEVAFVAVVGNLDGQEYVWSYPTTGLMDDADLNDLKAIAERLPQIEGRKI